jgi:hypothetical protein
LALVTVALADSLTSVLLRDVKALERLSHGPARAFVRRLWAVLTYALSHALQDLVLVCLVTNPDTDGFGQAQSQMSIQKHDVTVLGLDRCHAKEHGNYDECAHGAM